MRPTLQPRSGRVLTDVISDDSRLIHLTAPSTSQFMRIFRLTYFLLPISSTDSAMNNLKQCLHYDPDSKECFTARRLVKNFGKTFDKLENFLNGEDWKGVIGLLEKGGFANKFDQALDLETTQDVLGLPPWLKLIPPRRSSPRREVVLRALCKSYVHIGQPKKGEAWCHSLSERLGGEEDADALLGVGEALLADEEYEEAVRVMERAWDACGRKDRFFQQRLIRAQKLLKQSKQKDYYKVLGVPRDADQKTIKKALYVIWFLTLSTFILTFRLPSAAKRLSRHTRIREARKPRWPLSTKRTKSSRNQNYDNGLTTETTRTILWLNRVGIHSRAEAHLVEIRSPSSSSRVEVKDRDSSSLTDSTSHFIMYSFPPNHSFDLAHPPLHNPFTSVVASCVTCYHLPAFLVSA